MEFKLGDCHHQCSQNNFHLFRFSHAERNFLIKGLLSHDSAKIFWQKQILPFTKQGAKSFNEKSGHAPSRASRMLTMTVVELEAYARKWNLDKAAAKPGRDDFERARKALEKMRQDYGMTIAYKVPGQSVDSEATILEKDALHFLSKDDLFIFMMSRMQARLMQKFGTCIATDGTHAVFSYTKVKVIVVHVASRATHDHPKMKARGFPVAMVVTTSEREEIHKAIVVHIRAAVGHDWVPRLIMTDMAFSAFNAWKRFFPGLKWLWCKFHVWQAWFKRLKKMARTDEMAKAQFDTLKAVLIREVTTVISPKDEPDLTKEEFVNRCRMITEILWSVGLTDTAVIFEQYIKNQDMWSPCSRKEIVMDIYGTLDDFPILANSNNAVERFFGVLKHISLDGVPAKSITSFLSIWDTYQSTIYSNIVKAGVLDKLLEDWNVEPRSLQMEPEEEDYPLFASDIDDDSDDDDDAAEVPEYEPEPQPDLRETHEDRIQRVVCNFKKMASNVDLCLRSVVTEMDASSADESTLTELIKLGDQFIDAVKAGTSKDESDLSTTLGFSSGAKFVKQRENFGVPSSYVPLMSVPFVPVSRNGQDVSVLSDQRLTQVPCKDLDTRDKSKKAVYLILLPVY